MSIDFKISKHHSSSNLSVILPSKRSLILNLHKHLGLWGTFFFFETGFLCIALSVLELTLYTRLASNSEICLPLLSQVLGIKGVCHHRPASTHLLRTIWKQNKSLKMSLFFVIVTVSTVMKHHEQSKLRRKRVC